MACLWNKYSVNEVYISCVCISIFFLLWDNIGSNIFFIFDLSEDVHTNARRDRFFC